MSDHIDDRIDELEKEIDTIPCQRCGKIHHVDDSFKVYVDTNGTQEDWCTECFENHSLTCYDCEDTFSDHSSRLINDDNDTGNDVCHTCYSYSYSWCDYHDRYEHNDNYCPEGNGEDSDDSSNTDIRSYDDRVRYYDYKPDFKFYKTANEASISMASDYDRKAKKRKPVSYLGFELEIEIKDKKKVGEICDQISNFKKLVTATVDSEKIGKVSEKLIYMKSDGSLKFGLEIVSMPCTLEYHKLMPYAELFNQLVKLQARSHQTTTCGLHVHVGKKQLSDRQLQEINTFWSMGQSWIEVLSRRASCSYAKYKKVFKTDKTKIHSFEKYQAINHCNSSTIEFRSFKGTLNYATFRATLELVEASLKYVDNKHSFTCSNGKQLFNKFNKWLHQPTHASRYSFLVDYISLRLPQISKALEQFDETISIPSYQAQNESQYFNRQRQDNSLELVERLQEEASQINVDIFTRNIFAEIAPF